MNTELYNEFRAAWDGGELVFPRDPQSQGERWFLRTPINPSQERDLVFIGINPASATKFADNSSGGDSTTEMILKFFTVEQDGSPSDWRSMTIINLLPLIGQARDLPDWDSENGHQEIMETLEKTQAIFKTVIQSADYVHLMWGNLGDSNFPWKKTVLKHLLLDIDRLTANAKVQAYLSKEQCPLHPRFGGICHWYGKDLCTDRALLLEESAKSKDVAR